MLNLKINEIKSKYFDLNIPYKHGNHTVSKYEGWHGLQIIKINMIKGEVLNNNYFKDQFPEIYNKEKILVVTNGQLVIEMNSKFKLKEYDALNFFLDDEKYKITCEEDALIFIVSAKELKMINKEPLFFNFKKDIKITDLWGGQCISRPYEGNGLTLVLFDLKSGFKFEDKGHINEQITWIIKGEMNFHSNGREKILTLFNGVDVGPKHAHGGVSRGAIGFDAFYPKREESKYKKKFKTNEKN